MPFLQAEKASAFVCPEEAWLSDHEDVVRRVNGLLEIEPPLKMDRLGSRGAELCQLLHRCTVPEEVVDLSRVQFDAAQSPEQAKANFLTLRQSLEALGAVCVGPKADVARFGEVPPLLTDSRIECMAEGGPSAYGEQLDIMQWLLAFHDHMGEPMFYSASREREECAAARAAREKAERAAAAKTAAPKGRQAGVRPGARTAPPARSTPYDSRGGGDSARVRTLEAKVRDLQAELRKVRSGRR
eukprot:TRINITY_DN10784_c0_g1_i1.p1 TRINITY_DN10784_c0_g1~~TRINITY_DN10784_c0_g1_i1.p1  ORF type:complete len:261 (+),score=112.01 TRINITY_DN10784_c0_g1_i1:58-783(+)